MIGKLVALMAVMGTGLTAPTMGTKEFSYSDQVKAAGICLGWGAYGPRLIEALPPNMGVQKDAPDDLVITVVYGTLVAPTPNSCGDMRRIPEAVVAANKTPFAKIDGVIDRAGTVKSFLLIDLGYDRATGRHRFLGSMNGVRYGPEEARTTT